MSCIAHACTASARTGREGVEYSSNTVQTFSMRQAAEAAGSIKPLERLDKYSGVYEVNWKRRCRQAAD